MRTDTTRSAIVAAAFCLLAILGYATKPGHASAASTGNNWYVSTTGSSINQGTISSPWDLCTALGCSGTPPAAIQPGDTIWVEGGDYKGGFGFNQVSSSLKGTPTAAIWIRNVKVPPANYTGQLNPDGSERVIVDPTGVNVALYMSGQYTTVEGLEFQDSTTDTGNRYLLPTSSCITSGNPQSLCPPAGGGPEVQGPGDRVVHCIVHDLSQGIYSYSAGPNAEMYGNIVYYNGYIYGSEGLGHGFYQQNNNGNKWLSLNVSADNVDNGFQIYGSGGAAIGFVTSGNVSVDNGSIATWQYNVVIGSASGTSANKFDSFYSFFPLALRRGYTTIAQYDRISDSSVTNSVFAGGYTTLGSFSMAGPAIVTGNRLVNVNSDASGAPSYMLVFSQFSNQTTANMTWDNNQYYGGPNMFYKGAYNGTNLSNGAQLTFTTWQSSSGFDQHSTFTPTLPTGNWTYVLPDKYTTKRANIVIYNWDAYADQNGTIKSPCTGSCAAVGVDLSSVLSPGDPYQIQDALNWFGPPVASGTYQGGLVTVPMTGLSRPKPYGIANTPAHPAPAFGVFVVFSKNSVDIPQPAQPVTTNYVPPPPPPSTPPPPAVTPAFTIGQSVKVNSISSPANVRSSGATTSSITGTEPNGAVGTVVGGPNPIPATGSAADILWDVQFSDQTGWVWQSVLLASGQPATQPPTAPASPSESVQGKTVNLSWTASTTSGVSYSVWRGTASGGPYVQVVSGLSATTYTDSGPFTAGTTYYWVVRADLNGTESGNSNEVSALVVPNPNPTSTLAVSTEIFPPGEVGVAYTGSVGATGGTPPYSYSISGQAPGLNINAQTGAVTGTPTTAGSYTAIFTVTDSAAATATGQSTYTIDPAPAAPPTLSKNAVTLDASGNLVSDIETFSDGTTQDITAKTTVVQNAAPPPPPPPSNGGSISVVTTGLPTDIYDNFVLPRASIGKPYTYQFQATGGTGPYTWKVNEGSLGNLNLTLSSSGVLSGTPTTSTGIAFNMIVRDSTGAFVTSVRFVLVATQ